MPRGLTLPRKLLSKTVDLHVWPTLTQKTKMHEQSTKEFGVCIVAGST